MLDSQSLIFVTSVSESSNLIVTDFELWSPSID